MKKLTSLLKTTGLAAIGGLLLAAGASAGADPVKESAAKPEAPAAVQAPEKTAAAPCDENAAGKIKKDAKKEKKDKKKKYGKKTRLEKKHPERASGSK